LSTGQNGLWYPDVNLVFVGQLLEKDASAAVVSMMFILSVTVGFLLTVIGYTLAPVFLQWLNVPDEIYALAVEYLRF